MNLSWLTARDLEYVVAVARHLHFGKAARSCHVSQPALSSQIRKIESLLETRLFERTNRQVLITPEGELVARQAQVVLDEIQKLGESARHGKPALNGTFRIASISTLGPYLIPHLIAPLRKSYPQARFILREGLTEELVHALEAGHVDAVIAALPLDSSRITTYPLFFEPFHLLAPKGHPLLKSKSLEPRDLEANDMILLRDGHCLKDQTLELCSLGRGQPLQEFQATSLETVGHLVAAGLGYTLVPQLAAVPRPGLADLVGYRGFRDEEVGRTIALASRKGYPHPENIRAIVELIRSNLPKGLKSLQPSTS